MELASTQALLARLYTEHGFRERFLENPESAAAESAITPEEARQLADKCRNQLIGFARSLRAKRLAEVLSFLPRTANALGSDRFRRLFMNHAQDFVPSAINKPREDALAFAAWLETHPAEAGSALHIARFERCLLDSHLPRPLLLVRLFHLPENPSDPSSSPRWKLGIWLRVHRRAPLLHFLPRVPRVPCGSSPERLNA